MTTVGVAHVREPAIGRWWWVLLVTGILWILVGLFVLQAHVLQEPDDPFHLALELAREYEHDTELANGQVARHRLEAVVQVRAGDEGARRENVQGGAALPLPLAGEGWGGGAAASHTARVERAFSTRR